MHQQGRAVPLEDLAPVSVDVLMAIDAHRWQTQAYRSVYEHELGARLPHARLRFCSTQTDAHAQVTPGGRLIVPLGNPSIEDGGPDCLIVAAASLPDDEVLGTLDAMLGRAGQTVWSGITMGRTVAGSEERQLRAVAAAADLIAVRDAASRQRLADLGCGGQVHLVPNPLWLSRRLIDASMARSRVATLQRVSGYPTEWTLLVELGPGLLSYTEALTRAIGKMRADGQAVALVALPPADMPADSATSQALMEILQPAYHLGAVDERDRLSAFATAGAVVASTIESYVMARAFGRPAMVLAGAVRSEDGGSPATGDDDERVADSIARLRRRAADAGGPSTSPCRHLDAHFDGIAGLLLRAQARRERSAWSGMRSRKGDSALARAHAVRSRSLVEERHALAERVDAIQAALVGRVDAMQVALETARQEKADTDASAQALRGQLRDAGAEIEIGIQASRAIHRELTDASHRIRGLQDEVEKFRAMVVRFERSRSWRYLAPARAVAWWFRRRLGVAS